MPPLVRLVILLHDHQPVGNFDYVIEQAYQDSYRPLLDVLRRYSSLKIALHTSGALAEWLEQHHPDYFDVLSELVRAGRLEIVGGAYYEPILSMLSPRDRVGQIRRYTRWLEERTGAKIRGMWLAERVWEPCFTSDLVAAGIEYTLLDDFHFKNAGLSEDQLCGYYLTEDDGQLLKIFPGSERLRYLIPFGPPQETINYLRGIAESRPGAVVAFGDDGEKFGTWPGTKAHVYDNRWLAQFFDALTANKSWLQTITPAEALEQTAPVGKVYLPDGSYREMTEWALPAEQLADYEEARHELEHDPRWPRLQRFVRGGSWRNFRVKYPEADEMYARMTMVSRRLQSAVDRGAAGELIDGARSELYRAQCNCAYWHGAFGGIYLPHLRNAVYAHLIAADNLLDQAARRPAEWVEISGSDFNLDARQEVQLVNESLMALVAPARGGELYELDVRSICHNLLATLARRPEAYHRKIQAAAQTETSDVASIHERVVVKQQGLGQRLQYDAYRRKSLIDHFYDADVRPSDVAAGEAPERGDFVLGVYDARIRRGPDRVQAVLARRGEACGQPILITKTIALDAGRSALEITYAMEGVPADFCGRFAVEFNFAGLPAGADDRYFYVLDQHPLGQLGSRLALNETLGLGLADEWLGIGLGLRVSRAAGFWTFPIETVSGSEAGIELIHQSVVVMPHWLVQPDAEGRWQVSMTLSIDTSLAESRREPAPMAVAAR